MKETLIDIETYCEADIKKCGLYRYVYDPSFEILLIAWATDEGSGFGETKLADLASGDSFPQELLNDFKDSNVTLIAHNAAFERVSFSRYLQQHYPGQYLKPGTFLSPNNWICTMVMAASLTLPMALKDVGEVLRTTQQKDEEGKRLIKLFSAPCKPTKSNGGRTRNLPHHLPEDWAKFKYYCIQDVNTEVDIYKRLKRFPMPDREWHHYRVNERINDRGVRIDTKLVRQAITCDLLLSDAMTTKAYELTGLENPNSVSQLKTWLDERGISMDTLGKKNVTEMIGELDKNGVDAEAMDMKTGRNLQEVLVELDRQNKAKQDFISPAQGMRLREDGHTFELNHLTTDRQMTFGTTSLFHRQVASALGIPAKYYDLMQSQKPELLAENVNAWFADRTSSYMVRSMDYGSGQVARALLSERYRRIDNMEIATSVLPLFAGNDQYEVMSCEVTENRLYLKVVNHRLEMEVRKGDIVQAGVMISNSEVGLGAVSIQPLIYRLVCLNGMTVCDMGERRHHVGRQAKAVEDSFTLYSDETMEAEDKAFLLKLRDTTMAAIDEARFAQVVGRLQESMAVPITGKVQDVVQLTSQSYGINADEQEGILKYLIAGGDLSLYGLSNAVTRASQDVASYDRATALEGIGWQVATMEPAQWKEINR